MVEITDRMNLQVWLEALPGDDEERCQVAVQIAHRAAMRVLPIAWGELEFSDWARRGGLTAMPVLRSHLTCGVVAKNPLLKERAVRAACASVVVARDTANASADANASAKAAAASMEATAASASVSTCRHAAHAFPVVADAAEAAGFAARASGVIAISRSKGLWEEVAADCRMVEAALDPMRSQLWQVQENPLADYWGRISAQMLKSADSAYWDFWRFWYERSLHGMPQAWDAFLTDVALIEDEYWERGVTAVGEQISALQNKSTPSSPIRSKQIQAAVAANAVAIPSQVDALIAVLDDEIERLRGRNPVDDIEAEEIERLRSVFLAMRGAIRELGGKVHTEAAPTDGEADEIKSLLELYRSQLVSWPRENAADLVDSGCRTVLVGLSAGIFAACGAPGLAAIAVSGVLFGGKKLATVGKTVKDVTPSDG